MPIAEFISDDLMRRIRQEFTLEWDGLHGLNHWQRVYDNAMRLSEQTRARLSVITLFAFLHDAKRLDNGFDPGHGRRSAELVRSLQGTYFELPPVDLELLFHACEAHSDGLLESDITVQTCWDADRLDLGRIGVMPDPDYLCTAAAREPAFIAWAFERSRGVFGQY